MTGMALEVLDVKLRIFVAETNPVKDEAEAEFVPSTRFVPDA
jgi:hypothetical protein